MALGSHGVVSPAGAPAPPPGPPARGHERTRFRPCAIGQIPVRSGSPQAVLGCTQPLGVAMKWLASPGAPACPLAVTAKSAAPKAPTSRFLRAENAVDDIRSILSKGVLPWTT